MKCLFLSYELSLLAKEKGFDEPCLGCYYHSDKKLEPTSGLIPKWFNDTDYNKEYEHKISAPLYQQIIDWFRENKDIDITITPVFREKCGYDSFRRDGWSFTIIRIEPCQYLDFTMYNQVGEDRDEELQYPIEERVIPVAFKEYYKAVDKAIEEAFKLI